MSMKLAIGIGSLVFLLGAIAPANAQFRQPEKEQQRQGKPAQRQQIDRRGGMHGGVHHSGVPQAGQARAGFLQSRASAWDREHRSWSQRGGYQGFRVPDDRFRLYFGNNHFFTINLLPMVFVGGYPRFQYDGYWVTFVDSWPQTWAQTWFETDAVYIDYTNDGYYLYNRNHPGVAIAVNISL